MHLIAPDRVLAAYRLSLALVALAQVMKMGLFVYAAAIVTGTLDDPVRHGGALLAMAFYCLWPLLLIVPKYQPAFLRSPSRWYHLIFVLLLVAVLMGLSGFLIVLRAGRTGLQAEEARMLMDGLGPIGHVSDIAAALFVVLCIAVIYRSGKGRGGRGASPRNHPA